MSGTVVWYVTKRESFVLCDSYEPSNVGFLDKCQVSDLHYSIALDQADPGDGDYHRWVLTVTALIRRRTSHAGITLAPAVCD